MMNVSEKVLDKLAKLIRHEASAREIGSIAEADAFAEKIQNTLNEYHIALADVPLGQRPVDPLVQEKGDEGMPYYQRRVAWRERLARGISKGHDCRHLITSGCSRIQFVGHKSDVEVCKYLFSTLGQAAMRLAKSEYKKARKEGFGGSGFTQSFLQGFAEAVSQRLEARHQEQAAAHTAGTSALMVVRGNELGTYMKRFTSARRLDHSSRNLDARMRGDAAGRSINISAGGITQGATSRKGIMN